MSKSTLHLDLHPIAKNGKALDIALSETFATALEERVKAIEVIPGKGTGQLMKRVQKWLQRPAVKQAYKRVQVDPKNHGRLFIYLR